jgi:hypothetical protein
MAGVLTNKRRAELPTNRQFRHGRLPHQQPRQPFAAINPTAKSAKMVRTSPLSQTLDCDVDERKRDPSGRQL